MIVTALAAALLTSSPSASVQIPQSRVNYSGVYVYLDRPFKRVDTELPPVVEYLVSTAWSQAKATDQKQELPNQKDIDADKELGKEYSKEVEKEVKLSKNEEYIARIKRVSEPIFKVAQSTLVNVTWGDQRLSPFDYSIKVVEGDQVNAFSIPGGYLYFYEGLIKYAESDDELAGVIGHEVAHAAFRHLATLSREQSKFDILTLPLILVTILSGGRGGTQGALTLAQLASQAASSGWSQKAELSADYGSFQYLRLTQYNPVGLLTFMERLARDQRAMEAIDWGIYRSHPPSRERAEKITGYLEEAKIPIKRSATSTTFRVVLKETEGGKVEGVFNDTRLFVLGGTDAQARAKEVAVRLNDFFDQVPELYEVSLDEAGAITSRRKQLLQLGREDAEAMGTSLSAARDESLRAIKRALFFYAYRIWDAR
ncbi:MAG: M48 family metalloprotease [Fimbriimonadaceae bacterium]|nr:M48 family metalloprotease [Fimbriimonadaceae bacterium]